MTDSTNIPDLTIERNDDGTLTLEQNWSGNVDRVAVHAVHIRHLAELVGLIRPHQMGGVALSATPPSLAEVSRENDRLKRNLLRLREHALDTQRDFAENADWKHADLTHEMNNINALVDLFDMAVDDFADDFTAHPPSGHAVVTGDQRAATVDTECPPSKRSPTTARVRTQCGPSDRNPITPAAVQPATEYPVGKTTAKTQFRTECGIGKVAQLELPA